MMARRQTISPRPDPEMVPAVRGFYSGRPSVRHPLSNRWRGELLRMEVDSVEELLRAPLSLEIIQYFFPDVAARCGVDLEWIDDRLTSIRAGRGCGQITFARLVPIFWRMPHLGWRASMPRPPWPGYDMPFPDHIRRADGSVIPWPPGVGPKIPKSKKEAA